MLMTTTFAMDDNKTPDENENGLESLENPTTEVEPAAAPAPEPSTSTLESTPPPAPGDANAPSPSSPKPPKRPLLKRLGERFPSVNVYMLIFVLVLVVAAVVGALAFLQSKRNNTSFNISSQTLDQKALEQLANSDATIGSSSQVLNVQSSAIFAGKVLIRDTLEVAGGLQIGGNLSLAGVTVSGSSSFGQVQVSKNLTVIGDTALQGVLTVQKSLNVSGGGTFSGPLSAPQLTVTSLQLNGDLLLNHHLTAGGANPSRSNGSALGSGGTSSVSGSDTSGSISINTGSGASAGCFITVSFASRFNSTPRVLLTPVGSGAASINYYVNRSTSSFSVCAANTPPSNSSFAFDYFILD